MPRPTLIGISHEVFAFAHESAFAGRVGLTCATINHILKGHDATGTLVPGKSTAAPRQSTSHEDRALFKMVRQNCVISVCGLMARMANLYGIRAG